MKAWCERVNTGLFKRVGLAALALALMQLLRMGLSQAVYAWIGRGIVRDHIPNTVIMAMYAALIVCFYWRRGVGSEALAAGGNP